MDTKSQDSAFPETCITWIDFQLDSGEEGLRRAQNHVLEMYSHPLQLYLRRKGFATQLDVEDAVQDFLARRVLRHDYLDRWKRSGLPLRRWLANGAIFWVREVLKKKGREIGREGCLVEVAQTHTDETWESPEDALDRAFLHRLVHVSLRLAQSSCVRDGLATHWDVFYQHRYVGLSYNAAAERAQVSPERAAVMSRTAAGRFREALQSGLKCDGVPADRVRAAIEDLLNSGRF